MKKRKLTEKATGFDPQQQTWRLARHGDPQQAFLGTIATISLTVGDTEMYKDEVRLWQARSRERFIKRCRKILGRTPRSFSKDVDAWLRLKDREWF